MNQVKRSDGTLDARAMKLELVEVDVAGPDERCAWCDAAPRLPLPKATA